MEKKELTEVSLLRKLIRDKDSKAINLLNTHPMFAIDTHRGQTLRAVLGITREDGIAYGMGFSWYFGQTFERTAMTKAKRRYKEPLAKRKQIKLTPKVRRYVRQFLLKYRQLDK